MNNCKVTVLISFLSLATVAALLITPALVDLQSHFVLTRDKVQWSISAFLVSYVIGQLLYGPLANSLGALSALRFGLLLNLIGIIFSFVAIETTNYFVFLFGRFLAGLGTASGMPCAFILVNGLLSEKRAKTALSYGALSFSLATAISVFVGGLITHYWHWSYCFLILFAYGTLTYCLTFLFSEPLLTHQPFRLKTIFRDYQLASRSRSLIVFSFLLGFVPAFAYCYAATSPLYAIKILNLSAVQYGGWNLLTVLGSIVGSIMSARLIKSLGAKKIFSISIVGLLVCFLLLITFLAVLNPKPFVFFTIMMLFYLFNSFLFPSCSIYALANIKDQASSTSLMLFIYMSTAMLAVILMGYLPFSNLLSFSLTISTFFIVGVTLCLLLVPFPSSFDR